jgi:hypothetical protein
MTNLQEYWEGIYAEKAADSLSWFQEHADCSFRLIRETGTGLSSALIDVGGGASMLVDDLLGAGFTDLTVLDLSASAMKASKTRPGKAADNVAWIETDILNVELPKHGVNLWHDRAVFHFLTLQKEREIYV